MIGPEASGRKATNDPPTLLPAVDVAAGRAAQVVDGGTDDPAEVARRWVDQGATWVHLVDLDRAYRRGDNLALLTDLIAELQVPVQLSGGLDTPEVVEAALATGAARLNLAVTALRHPAWVADLARARGERICLGLDLCGTRVVARGSGEDLGELDLLLTRLAEHFTGAGPAAYLVADASRDGTRAGADTALFAAMVRRLDAPVIASGGVATLADLAALATTGVSGVVLGSALYHGRFTVADALSSLSAGPIGLPEGQA